MLRLVLLLFVAACGALRPADVSARQASSVSVDASFGLSHGSGGEFVHRRGVALETLLGARVNEIAEAGLVGGLAATVHGRLTTPDICIPDTEGGCIPDLPLPVSVGTLVGLERALAVGNAGRALAGFAYFWDPDVGGRIGLRGTVDVAIGSRILAPVLSLSGAVLGDGEGNLLRVGFSGRDSASGDGRDERLGREWTRGEPRTG